MTFRETLNKHIAAITSRDIEALVETLPQDELVLVMSNGKVVRAVREFVEAHRDWFAMPNWLLHFEPVEFHESVDLGVAIFKLDYTDLRPDGSRFHEFSVLTLTFARR